jgi:hypothetical protein
MEGSGNIAPLVLNLGIRFGLLGGSQARGGHIATPPGQRFY